MAFHPTADRVLIQQHSPETTTSSGFIIPQTSLERMNQGTVITHGPGRTTDRGVHIPMTVTVGATVVYEPGAAIPIKVEGTDYLVVKEEHIIAVVADE